MNGEVQRPESKMTGELLVSHLRQVEGTEEGEPSGEDVPIFPKAPKQAPKDEQ